MLDINRPMERIIEQTLVTPVYRPIFTMDNIDNLANGVGNSGRETITLAFASEKIELSLPEGQMIILGRYHDSNKIQPTLDLNKFGGGIYGTSRMHAALRREFGEWLIEDLDSSNGTWVNGVRLAPFAPFILQRNNQIMLANLEFGLVLPEKIAYTEVSTLQ